MGIKTVPHRPYSPDLAPCDFCLFPNLRGCRYETIEEMKKAMTKVIETLRQEDFHGAFQKVLETVQQVHCSRRRLLRRGLEFHVGTINKSAHIEKSGNLFNDPRIITYRRSWIPSKWITESMHCTTNFIYIYIYIYIYNIYIYIYIYIFNNMYETKLTHLWSDNFSLNEWISYIDKRFFIDFHFKKNILQGIFCFFKLQKLCKIGFISLHNFSPHHQLRSKL